MQRCRWCNEKNPIYVKYHDEEWGVPRFDDQYLFEMLILEGFQAGLSWECVLNKRENFREAFKLQAPNVKSVLLTNKLQHPAVKAALLTNGCVDKLLSNYYKIIIKLP